MAHVPDHLGRKINQLLRVTQLEENNGPAEKQQQADHQRLQTLSVETTSGDTLVIVRFPTGNFVDCDRVMWETKEFLMDSERLRATGSSVFAKKLSPAVQAQVRRRLDRETKLHMHTKYVLDLTPPTEGDELASQVVDMSLSDGIRDWWRSHFISNISKYLVAGHDDVCPEHIELLLSEFQAYDKRRRPGDPINGSELEYPAMRKIEDYCPIRHRVAILRLLMAISYGDLVLNAAPRMATMTVVARSLDCVGVVKDHILSWLIAEPNQNFIDVNAEDALNVAWTLELRSVARTAFRVLVAERAIEDLDKTKTGTTRNRGSIFGRPRGTLNEEPETCIQHAAQKLSQRAEDLLARLQSDEINTCLGIKLWPEHDPDLCKRLQAYMHAVVRDSVSRNIETDIDIAGFNRNRARYVSAADLVPVRDIYTGLSHAQRLMTPWFWSMFGTCADSTHMLYHLVDRHFLETSSPSNLIFLGEQQIPAATFDVDAFHREFSSAVLDLSTKWMYPDLEVNIVRTGPLILALSDEEFKFLPLWAGGFDDGTGGVFQPDVPDAERGFPIGPGPSFHTGETIPEDDEASTIKGSDDAFTTATGADTDSVTKGYSVNATAPSRVTGVDHDGAEDSQLAAAAAAQLLLTVPQHSAMEIDNLAAHTSTASPDTSDWTMDSDDEYSLSPHHDLNLDLDLDNDDFEDVDDA